MRATQRVLFLDCDQLPKHGEQRRQPRARVGLRVHGARLHRYAKVTQGSRPTVTSNKLNKPCACGLWSVWHLDLDLIILTHPPWHRRPQHPPTTLGRGYYHVQPACLRACDTVHFVQPLLSTTMLAATMRLARRGVAVALARPAARFSRCATLLTAGRPATPLSGRVGRAVAFGGLASVLAEATRCDDDDDDEDDGPKTPSQLAHAAKIKSLTEQAGSVRITPGMAIFLVGGLAMPLGGFIAQGGALATTFGGLLLSFPCLYAVVGLATQVSEKEGLQLLEDAKERKIPTLLVASLAVGIIAPAVATVVRSGNMRSTIVAVGGSIVTTALTYQVCLFTPTE